MDNKFSRMVLPTSLLNTNRDHQFDKEFRTNDYVFVDSGKDLKISPVPCTDYALLCGADHAIRSLSAPHLDNEAAYLWGRVNNSTFIDKTEAIKVMPHPYIDNQFTHRSATSRGITTCPAMNLSLDLFRNNPQCRFNNNRYGDPLVTLGLQYPKSHGGKNFDRQLEKDRNEGRLVRTGAKYFGFVNPDGTVNYNYEYAYPDHPHGYKYVHTQVNLYDENQQNILNSGDHAPKNGKYVWTQVLPVIFKILNWEELPRDINPLGSGNATGVKVIASEGLIAGLPFALDTQDPNYGLWQNSPIRAYLNGYDLAQELTNYIN